MRIRVLQNMTPGEFFDASVERARGIMAQKGLDPSVGNGPTLCQMYAFREMTGMMPLPAWLGRLRQVALRLFAQLAGEFGA